ncbi:hypothetical protein [Homoserinibacter gongjuensis]|jgi:hypothetical protein|uniref:Integral membrane protein n=1 Tax=Homoserinibacter gongjuensis TaxID=1162968 RepID=A0ABQ6JU60_9MICO|nr:hypothetical protein [Homoserinibacter gongjuensis]GMA90815.1 hypothetical protein GCM10025869_13440 [Homoserinibacter gongjuensis]
MRLEPTVLTLVAGGLAAVLYLGLSAFQLALAAGAPWGRAAFGGQHPGTLPARLRVSSAVATVVWAAVALIVARHAGLPVWAPLPDAWLAVAVWVATALGVVAIALNALTPSRIERAIWLPISVLLFSATAIVALSASG